MAAVWLVGALTFKWCIFIVRATVDVQIEYVGYRNPQGKTREGKHCDAFIFGGSTSACDPYFEMCINTALINDSGSAACSISHHFTSRFWDKNEISASEFKAAVGIRTFQVSSMSVLHAAFVRVTVHEWDYLADDVIDVYHWQISRNLTADFQWIYANLSVDDRTIQYRLRARCSPHYYQSSCHVFCQPASNPALYLCDNNGTRVYPSSAAMNTTSYGSTSGTTPIAALQETEHDSHISAINPNGKVAYVNSTDRSVQFNSTNTSPATSTEVSNFTQSLLVDVSLESTADSYNEMRRLTNVSFTFLQFQLTDDGNSDVQRDQAFRFEICISQLQSQSQPAAIGECGLLRKRTAFLVVHNRLIDSQQFAQSLGTQFFSASLGSHNSLMLRFTAQGNSSVSPISEQYTVELSNAATQYNLVRDGATFSFRFELVALLENNVSAKSMDFSMKRSAPDNANLETDVKIIIAVVIPLIFLIAFGCVVYLVRHRMKKSNAQRIDAPVSTDLYEEIVKERMSTAWGKFVASLRNLLQTRSDTALQGATQCDARSKEKSSNDYAKPADNSINSAFSNATYVEISGSATGTLANRKVVFHASASSSTAPADTIYYCNALHLPNFNAATNLLDDPVSKDKENDYSYPGDAHAAPSSPMDRSDLTDGESKNWLTLGLPYASPSSIPYSDC